MNIFKRFVAFAIAAVMICGMLPVSASATENHSHDHVVHSDIQPFTGTADLIAQVQSLLVQKGAYGTEEVDQDLIEAVEEMSGTAYNQAATTLALGFFNDRVGSEGRIDTAHLNLDEATMSSLVEKTLKAYHLDGIVEVNYVVKYDVVAAVTFTMRESFAAGLDQIETGITDIEAVQTAAPAVKGSTVQTAARTAEKKFPFTDVPNWARTAVNYLYQRDIVNGVSATKYGSNQSVTRGQAVTMIYRAMGAPKVSAKNPFKDVAAGKFYTDAVIWAAAEGVVTGTSATTFEPNASVTREQLVTIIYRLAGEYMGMDVSKKASLSKFSDGGRVAKYAQEAVKWAVGTELVNGYTDGTFRPKNVANRAEYAQVLYKFLTMHAHKGTLVEAKAASCTEPGNSAYYTCSCGKFFSDAACTKEIAKDSWVLKATGHKLTAHAAKEPTDTEAGNTAYWSCDNCGKFFADAEGKKEIAKNSWMIEARGHKLVAHAAVAPTCTEPGNTAYWSCQTCDRFYADAEAKTQIEENSWVIEANGHKWGEWIVTDEDEYRVCEVCGEEQHCRHEHMDTAATATFNWVETPEYIPNADGSYGLNPEAFFLDENGYPIMEYDQNGNPVGPVTVGAYPDGSAITSVTLVMQQNADTGEYEISAMPTRIPDIYIDWNDADGNGAMDENEIAESIEKGGYHTRMAWNCTTVDVICPDCGGAIPNENVTVEQNLVDQAYIEEAAKNSAMGAMMADEAAMATFQTVMEQRMGELMAEGKTQEEAQAQAEEDAFGAVLQNHPNVYMAMNQTIDELQAEYNSVLYTASVAMSEENVISDTMNATQIYLDRTWANMCNFNEVYAKYFGAASPYWTSKNEEEGPMTAFKYVLNMQEEPFIPNSVMDYYMGMLTQAFMSYVQSYAGLLDMMLADAMNTIAPLDEESFDTTSDRTIADLLLLHDWLAAYGEFDMQSLVDQQTGASAGSDPITMTAFGTLLHEQLGIDGAVCLGYAATYNLLVQLASGMIDGNGAITDKAPVVDFVQIKYLTNVAESSVAAGDSGFGDGDAMFNSPHFLNAVKLDNGNWYYIDACYDDINTEVISQERVETDGNISHNSFLLAPSTWDDMYDGNFQYMDSLYDGRDWVRVPDGQGGYKMRDNKGNVYETEQAAKDAKEADENLQIFYVYEAENDPSETGYTDTKYETSWFVSATGAVTYHDGYFYYTSGAVNSYSSMKDMFGDEEEDGSGMGDMEMDQDDMLEYKHAPSAKDKVVRRPVGAKTNTDTGNDSGMSMNTNNDEECEILFHFGYGTTGAKAQEQYEADINDNSMSFDSGIAEEDKGPYYALTQEDKVYVSNYPEICHSTVLIDGAIYFNMGNAIYTFNHTADEMAANSISSISNLELVKVKEYNDVYYTNLAVNPDTGANRFTGKTFVTTDSGDKVVRYHPIAALSANNAFEMTKDAEGNTNVNVIPSLFVSIATNFSNSYKTEVTVDGETTEQAYLTEARNYNEDYYRFMEEEEEETSEDVNDNVEFMWTASIVDSMTVVDFTSELGASSGTEVSVEAYCGHNAFTEQRTAKCGLSVAGTRVEQKDTALDHAYAMDEDEGTNICSVCLENHEHDYSYATAEDIDFIWTVNTTTTTAEDGSTVTVEKLTAEAIVACGNDEFCAEDLELECTVTDNGDGSFTATAKHGTITAEETKTVDQVNHVVHNYGAPVFTWTSSEETKTNEDGTATTVTVWAATATFTCEAEEADCTGSDAEGERVVVADCTVADNNGEQTATVTGPDSQEYTDTLHVYSNEKDEEGNYLYITSVIAEDADTMEVTYKCTVCGHTITVKDVKIEDEVVTANTCTTDGLLTHSASCQQAAELNGTEGKTENELPLFEYYKEDVIVAEGHKHEETSVEWSGDYGMCYVTYTCSCGDSYERSASSELTDKKDPTCEEDGYETYTAVIKNDDGTERGTYTTTRVLTRIGHKYGDATVSWTYTAATAEADESMAVTVAYVCTNGCGHEEVKEVSDPVKGEDGVWTATYIHNGETITVTHQHSPEGECVCGFVNPEPTPDPEPAPDPEPSPDPAPEA